jgi:hypothetical protein
VAVHFLFGNQWISGQIVHGSVLPIWNIFNNCVEMPDYRTSERRMYGGCMGDVRGRLESSSQHPIEPFRTIVQQMLLSSECEHAAQPRTVNERLFFLFKSGFYKIESGLPHSVIEPSRAQSYALRVAHAYARNAHAPVPRC